MDSIQNRDAFLDNIAQQLNRPLRLSGVERPAFKYRCQQDVMVDFTQAQLAQALVEYTETNLGAQAQIVTSQTVTDAVLAMCKTYAQKADEKSVNIGDLIIGDDPRLLNLLHLNELCQADHKVKIWDQLAGYEENIAFAERANVGIVFAEQALAESGTMVLYSNPKQGRSISLLPEASIFIIPQSALVPRMTQAMAKLHKQTQEGERVPSCVNLISGPSSTADIELIKVVGVHGPMYACYLIVSDL